MSSLRLRQGDYLDACYGSEEIDQRDLLFQQVGALSASPARQKMQVTQFSAAVGAYGTESNDGLGR